MDTTTLSSVTNNPLFNTLVKRRRRFVAWLTTATIVPYYALILVAIYAPQVLASRISSGNIVSVGWVGGSVLMVGTWILTGLYVRRSNGEFDGLTAQILAGDKP